MKVIRHIPKKRITKSKTAVTVGVFDGVHRGHQKVIRKLTEVAKKQGLKSTVITFEPHPKSIHGFGSPPLINTLGQRLELIAELGVDISVVVDFNREFAGIKPSDFIKQILVRRFNIGAFVASKDYRFGRGAKGDISFLKKIASGYDFKVYTVAGACLNKKLIKSTTIRNELASARIRQANAMLGRSYFIDGRVIKGRGVGRKLGFPTINLSTRQDILPPEGVYLSYTGIKAKKLPCLINILRVKKTHRLLVEAYILNFKGNLYRSRVRLYFADYARKEKKFKSRAALVKAIEADVAAAERFFM